MPGFRGRAVAQRVMGTVLVVLEHPPVGRLAHVLERCEQVQIAHLVAVGAVEQAVVKAVVDTHNLTKVVKATGSRGHP